LDLAKLDKRQFTLNEKVFDLNKTVVRVLDMVSLQAYDKGIMLRATIDNPESLNEFSIINGDERRYQQFLLNFLNNSLKFTNDGGMIQICLQMIKKENGKKTF
jgi:signal transduction histidine kinase